MDYPNIRGHLSDSLNQFLEQWDNNSDYIIAHTSGSTGTPKEIKLLKTDMLASAKATCQYFRIGEGSCLVNPLSVDYIAGKMMVVRALVSGANLWNEKPSSLPLNNWTISNYIDLLPVVPAQIPYLLESGKLKCVKNLIIGGAKLSNDLEQSLIQQNINAYCTYGMTETCSHVALRTIGQKHYKSLPGYKFSVDDRKCLIIESDTMSFRRLVTNDIVELCNDECFEWLGRIDNVVNSGGIKLFPEMIESKIESLFQGRNFYISSRESERWGNELILIVEGCEEIKNLHESLSERLSKYEIPKQVIYKENLEKTSSGKIKRI